jgi:uronate dehydrogenase
VCDALSAAGHVVHGLDVAEGEARVARFTRGSVAEGGAWDAAMVQGVDTLVHLAAYPHGDATFPDDVWEANYLGTFHALEHAAKRGLRRVVLASTCQTVSGRPKPRGGAASGGGPVGVDEAYPRNHYAVSKLWAEDMARLYAGRHKLSIVCVRIAWFPRDVDEVQRIVRGGHQSSYLSHDDTGRFFCRSVDADVPEGAHVVYLVSRPPEGAAWGFDMQPARELLGFEPVDRWPNGMPERLRLSAEVE